MDATSSTTREIDEFYKQVLDAAEAGRDGAGNIAMFCISGDEDLEGLGKLSGKHNGMTPCTVFWAWNVGSGAHHSEECIFCADGMRQLLDKGVTALWVFSERSPCSTCEPVVRAALTKIEARATIYFAVKYQAGCRPAVAQFRMAHGVQ